MPTLALALALACAGPESPPSPGATAPILGGQTHVVFVIIDTLRADHVGAWGWPHPTTPRVDALAKHGVRVETTWSASSWTRPGVGALLTGHYPRTLGLYEEAYDRLPDDSLTLAEILSERGYTTLGVTSNPNTNSWFGFDQGFDLYGDAGVLFKFMRERDGFTRFTGEGEGGLEVATTVTERALALVDERGGEGPMYLQVLYIDPHLPHGAPPEHVLAVRGSAYASYDAEIHYADAELGRLLDGLADRGFLEDALVVVTSDHGEGLDSHRGLAVSTAHGWYLYDSMLHVPLVFSHPSLPQGTEVGGLWSTLDVTPTVLDLLGYPTPDAPGRSMAAAVRGGAAEGRTHAVAETDWRVGSKTAVRDEGLHLVRNPDARAFAEEGIHEGKRLTSRYTRFLKALPYEELYPADLDEQVPVRSVLGERDVETAALRSLLDAWERDTPARPPINRSSDDVVTLGDGTVVPALGGELEHEELDDATAAQLRALGYLD